MSETEQPDQNQTDEDIRATLSEIGGRLPNYAKLTYRLVGEGLMTSGQQGQILGPLGYGPLARVTRFVPGLAQITRLLSMVSAVRFALTQMDPEVADQHLEAVGLTREQVEADFRVTRDLAKRAGMAGTQHASRALEDGARVAGRLAGRGFRSFRSWQARQSGSGDSSSGSDQS